jgi:hypothetical protein
VSLLRKNRIHINGSWLNDQHGRTLILRGVNLGGSSKVPLTPDGATYIREGFFNHREVSFVGRPFPLPEADEHFRRLRQWGLTFLRLLITWEAIEHAGPGRYDQEYLEYLRAIVNKAAEHGLEVFIDPHQDVWSRFSGGDGAPAWTFEVVGLDITKFTPTGAAIVHQVHGDPFPRMIWPSNSGKLAAATMFTLFFGGNDFAPRTRVEAEPVQDYLQRHYLAAMQQVAHVLKDLPNVIGYDTMNEPLAGYIGWKDLRLPGGLIKLGDSPSPWQSMLLASGMPQEVEVWKLGISGSRKVGTRLLNQEKHSAWLAGYDCVWRQNGVWDYGKDGLPELLRPDHFTTVSSRQVDFNQDYLRPFANQVASAIRAVDPAAIIFVETQPEHPLPDWGEADAQSIVSAPHWYDSFVLYLKNYHSFLAVENQARKLVLGPRRIRQSFAQQLGSLKEAARQQMRGAPTLIGEFGIAFDMQNKKAYRTGDFDPHTKALDRSFRAMDDNLLSCTLWNYTADNTNARGDQWNDEDLSIFSRDQQQDRRDPNSGGRALPAVVRPYAQKIAGEPLRMSFDLKRGIFELEFRHDPDVLAPTEIFLPSFHYAGGFRVHLSDGSHEYHPDEQILIYRHTPDIPVHSICIKRQKKAA